MQDAYGYKHKQDAQDRERARGAREGLQAAGRAVGQAGLRMGPGLGGYAHGRGRIVEPRSVSPDPMISGCTHTIGLRWIVNGFR